MRTLSPNWDIYVQSKARDKMIFGTFDIEFAAQTMMKVYYCLRFDDVIIEKPEY